MNRQTIGDKVNQTLREIQLQGGYAAPAISDKTRPLEDLEGFDSELAVEATSELSRKLGITIPAGENVFKAKGIARPLTVKEIVDALARTAATEHEGAGDRGGQSTAGGAPRTAAAP